MGVLYYLDPADGTYKPVYPPPATDEVVVDTVQPSSNTVDIWVDPSGTGGGIAVPIGCIMMWAGSAVPTGWLFCDGSVKLISDYPTLAQVCGSLYATGGELGTQFRLPNFNGRVAAGYDTTQTEFNTIGKSTAASTKTHAHTLSSAGAAAISLAAQATPNVFMYRVASGSWTANFQTAGASNPAASTTAQTVGASLVGSTDAGSTLQPYLTVPYIIRAV